MNPIQPDLSTEVLQRVSRLVKAGETLCVGVSGGLDSVVLLEVLSGLRAKLSLVLSAVHVHHGLSPNADAWAQFCQTLCDRINVPLHVARVTLRRDAGHGLEAAARDARYAAYAMLPVDWIALAHHADDNAETFLLRLFRGAGIKGLASVPPVRPLNERTRIMRPLLQTRRSDLQRYAHDHRLEWIEDESNDNTTFDRNFLRREIMPKLTERFPALPGSINRAAQHATEAQQLLDDLARMDLRHAQAEEEGVVLPVSMLCSLSAARAKNVLRYFLSINAVAMPDSTHLGEALRQIRECSEESQLLIDLEDWKLRKYRNHLILTATQVPDNYLELERAWSGECELELVELGGRLSFMETRGTGIRKCLSSEPGWVIRRRAGGEHLRPEADRPTRTLKNLFQERAIPAWERDRLPLLYHHERLVWVPGIGIDCAYQCAPDEEGLAPNWTAISIT